jgi:hypothetical protein
MQPKPANEPACFQRFFPKQKTKSFKTKKIGMTEIKKLSQPLTDNNPQLPIE